jgi:hypothetical protein
VKGLSWKVVAVAALVAAIVVPAASATSSPHVDLALLPLQKAALGAAGKPLALQVDSGAVPNAVAAGNSLVGTSQSLKKLGRISGYLLDYGVGSSGGSGVTEIWTSADQYKTAVDAKKGLAFWKKTDPGVKQLDQGSFAVTGASQKVPAVGSGRFAYLASFSDTNIAPVWAVDEHFTVGAYELEVTVWAGSKTAATKLAPLLAKKLAERVQQALKGKLHGKAAKLPKLPPAGQAAGGPDLSTLALQPTDFTGSTTVVGQGYVQDSPPLSTYDTFMEPAGQYFLFDQEIFWYPNANEAAYAADLSNASFLSGGGASVDLTAVGDGAQGVLDNESQGSAMQVTFAVGQLEENVVGIAQSTIQPSDVQNVAQSAANYIDNAGLGS